MITLSWGKSGEDHWTSTNNNYTITRSGRGQYVVREGWNGTVVGETAKNFADAKMTATEHQNGIGPKSDKQVSDDLDIVQKTGKFYAADVRENATVRHAFDAYNTELDGDYYIPQCAEGSGWSPEYVTAVRPVGVVIDCVTCFPRPTVTPPTADEIFAIIEQTHPVALDVLATDYEFAAANGGPREDTGWNPPKPMTKRDLIAALADYDDDAIIAIAPDAADTEEHVQRNWLHSVHKFAIGGRTVIDLQGALDYSNTLAYACPGCGWLVRDRMRLRLPVPAMLRPLRRRASRQHRRDQLAMTDNTAPAPAFATVEGFTDCIHCLAVVGVNFRDRPVEVEFGSTWCPHGENHTHDIDHVEYERARQDGLLAHLHAGDCQCNACAVSRKADEIMTEVAGMIAEQWSSSGGKVIPRDVFSFSSLHDYCDANCLGGFCDPEWFDENRPTEGDSEFDPGDLMTGLSDKATQFINDVQTEVSQRLGRQAFKIIDHDISVGGGVLVDWEHELLKAICWQADPVGAGVYEFYVTECPACKMTPEPADGFEDRAGIMYTDRENLAHLMLEGNIIVTCEGRPVIPPAMYGITVPPENRFEGSSVVAGVINDADPERWSFRFRPAGDHDSRTQGEVVMTMTRGNIDNVHQMSKEDLAGLIHEATEFLNY